jgi:hypothetical protein
VPDVQVASDTSLLDVVACVLWRACCATLISAVIPPHARVHLAYSLRLATLAWTFVPAGTTSKWNQAKGLARLSRQTVIARRPDTVF